MKADTYTKFTCVYQHYQPREGQEISGWLGRRLHDTCFNFGGYRKWFAWEKNLKIVKSAVVYLTRLTIRFAYILR